MTDVENGKFDNTEKSALDMRDDPFAPRDGKTLTWKDVDMTLVSDHRVESLAWGLEHVSEAARKLATSKRVFQLT